MKGWDRIKIAPHAVERYIQRVAPGMQWAEAEALIRSQLETARKAGTALGGGDVWCLSPLAYVVITRDRSKRGQVVKTVLLPSQVTEGRELLSLQQEAEDAGVPVPEVQIDAQEPEPEKVLALVTMKPDPKLIECLEKFAEMAREAKLRAVTIVYQHANGEMGFHSVMTPEGRPSSMIGELTLVTHVLSHNEATKYGNA